MSRRYPIPWPPPGSRAPCGCIASGDIHTAEACPILRDLREIERAAEEMLASIRADLEEHKTKAREWFDRARDEAFALPDVPQGELTVYLAEHGAAVEP